MEVKGLDMMNAIREYLIPIMKRYEIWEPLAEFLGIDPEDGPVTLFDDLTRFNWTIDNKKSIMSVVATYREDRIVRFNVELYPHLNDDRRFLKKFSVATGLLEEAKSGSFDAMELFEVNATPYMEENQVEYMIVTALVNGVDIYDTANHILQKDADIPCLGSIEKSTILEEPSGSFKTDSVEIKVSEDLFTVPFMYELLKRTAEVLHLNSPIYDGPIRFSVPYDTSYERTIEYNKEPDVLKYSISGSFEMNDGKKTVTRVAVNWRVQVMDGIIKLIPSCIHMADEYTNDLTTAFVRDWERDGTFSVSVYSKSDTYGIRAKNFSLPINYSMDYRYTSNFYEVYNYLKNGDAAYSIDQILRIAHSYMTSNAPIDSTIALANAVELYHRGGYEALDYTRQDMITFLDDIVLGECDGSIAKQEILDQYFSTTLNSAEEQEDVILMDNVVPHISTERINRVIQSLERVL